MKDGFLFGALVLVLTFGASCGDDDDDGSGGSGDMCAKSCATAAQLNCPNDDLSTCESDCEATLALEICQAENRALAQCTANAPASDFECDSFGEAELKAGVCETEGTAAMTCMIGGMGTSGNGAAGSEAGAGGSSGGQWFTCSDGDTIPPDWVCDGDPDCPNGEDEQNCS